MGAVSIDLSKKEREFYHLTLSDSNVVRYLIEFRDKVDVSYGANTNINMYQAGDMFEFNQELIALYSSLDQTIDKCNFREKPQLLLRLLFEGNTITDICKQYGMFEVRATYYMFERIVNKIVETNNNLWYYVMGHNENILNLNTNIDKIK